MRMSRFAAAGVGAVAALILGGCANPAAEPFPTTAGPTSEAPAPTAEETPEPEPTVDPHPALAELVISPSGLGPLTVGTVAPAANPGAAMIEWDAGYCADMTDDVAAQGRWVASGYDEDTNYVGEPATPFYVDASEAGVHRIDVMGSGPGTAEGIRIGSTLEELQAAHPTLAGPYDGPVSQVWWIQEAAGAVVFETQGDAGGLRPPGTAESVILIRVLAPGSAPDFATANSDNVAGGCL